MSEHTADAAPFDLAAQGAAAGGAVPAALCLHGLTGTPYEVRPLAEALAARGFRALGPRLPGHEGDPRRLARTSSEQWLEAVRGAHARLAQQHERICVVGLSLGGLLALALAAEVQPAATAVIGTPLHFPAHMRVAIRIGRRLVPMLPKRGGPDIADPAARARHPGYPVMPLAAVVQLLGLQRRVARSLPRITGPLLIAHGALDRTAAPDNVERIARAAANARVEKRVFARSAHVVPVDRDGAELAAVVAEFFTRAR